MSDGLRLTAEVLSRSRNRAVLPLLAAALRSRSPAVRAEVMHCAMRRRDLQSHVQLIRHFSSFSDADRQVLGDAYRVAGHRFTSALKQVLLRGSGALFENACRILVLCRDYGLTAALVKALQRGRGSDAACALGAVVELAQRLHEEITAWNNPDEPRGPDPSFARHQALAAIEPALEYCLPELRQNLLDAFLLLAPAENAALVRILEDPDHSCHTMLVAALTTGDSPGATERLIALLRDTDAPTAALEAAARRTDSEFVGRLLGEMKYPVPLRVLHNMKRVHSVAWLEGSRGMLLELNGRSQAIAVELCMASGMPTDSQLELLAFVLKHGLAEGRRAACQALSKIEDSYADELVLLAIRDADASVQAAAARQLRTRRVPNALPLLVALLEAPAVEVREAARSSLAEFNFVRYRAMFDLLDERAVKSTGLLVRQVDPAAQDKLLAELRLPNPANRLRAIEMAVAMEAVSDVLDPVIELTGDPNPLIRQAAAAALAHAPGDRALEALQRAGRDSHASVRQAALQSLEQRSCPAGTTS